MCTHYDIEIWCMSTITMYDVCVHDYDSMKYDVCVWKLMKPMMYVYHTLWNSMWNQYRNVCVHTYHMIVWNMMYVVHIMIVKWNMSMYVYTRYASIVWNIDDMCTHYDSMKYDVCVHIMIVWNMTYVYTLW